VPQSIVDLDNLEELVTEYVAVTELKAETESRLKHLRGELLTRLDVGTHDIADRKVIVAVRGTLDKTAIAAAYPWDNHPDMYAVDIDTKAVRHHLAPATLEAFTNYSDPTVSVR
jgi:hypothetical protein